MSSKITFSKRRLQGRSRTHTPTKGRPLSQRLQGRSIGTSMVVLACVVTLAIGTPALPGHAHEVRADQPLLAANEPATVLSPASAMLPVVYRVNTDDPVVFLTVDDGIVRSREARDWVRRKKIPVTSFVTLNVADGHLGYFAKISKHGSVQNHTVSHPAFDTYPGDLRRQICPVQDRLTDRLGTRPWMLRPPYGAGARLARVHAAASSCGIRHMVMWDAVVDRGRLTTWNGQRLSRGSIILLHFGPNLKAELRLAVKAARAQGLKVAALEDYLRAPKRN